MDSGVLKRLHKIIPEHELNIWERDALLELLGSFSSDLEQIVLEQIEVIWPVSHSLGFAFLEQIENGLSCLTPAQLPEWVKGILDRYEADGLQSARIYMSDIQNNFICQLQEKNGLEFSKIAGSLLPYIRGLSHRPLQLEPSNVTYTNTNTIFLPKLVTFFPNNKDNYYVYKLLASYQWAYIAQDIYCQQQSDLKKLETFFLSFSHRQLAMEVYHLLQTIRTSCFLQTHLPGLMKDGHTYFTTVLQKRPDPFQLQQTDSTLEAGYQWLLAYCAGEKLPILQAHLETIITGVLGDSVTTSDIFIATEKLYTTLFSEATETFLAERLPFQGELRLKEARQTRLARREEQKQHFIKALALLLPSHTSTTDTPPEQQPQEKHANITEKGACVIPLSPAEKRSEKIDTTQYENDPRYICLDDEHIKLSAALQELADEIREDMGDLPSLYISSAGKISGGRGKIPSIPSQDSTSSALLGGLLYNEWDFRRQGFRKNWCRLIEKKINPVTGTFISSTLEKYKEQIIHLKRQFEMMRTSHCFVKRQKEGEDIDLDAITEAYADVKADISPGERLFIRLQRNQRDITALFLVDMSSSTEGWVGKALKESLVLLSESLHSVGDRYAIYGFSGMRRNRSEIFRIKEFTESYTETIKNRIAAISPMDYTRMGPPIRHFTEILKKMDTKIRLLILLTDGKPEDYDDYKGQYAIEDTRHALLEAKTAGIHPFCISIDRQAQDYLGHLFGEMNYIFIDDVKKLPWQVPNSYRILTS